MSLIHKIVCFFFCALAYHCSSQIKPQQVPITFSKFEISIGEGMSVYPKLGVNPANGSFVPKTRMSASLLSTINFVYHTKSHFSFSLGYSRNAVSVSRDVVDNLSTPAGELVRFHDGFNFRLNSASLSVARTFSNSNYFLEPSLSFSLSHLKRFRTAGYNYYLLFFRDKLTTGTKQDSLPYSDLMFSTKTSNLRSVSTFIYAGKSWRNFKISLGVGFNRVFDSPFEGWYKYRVSEDNESRGNLIVKTNHLDVLLRVSYRFDTFDNRMQKKIDRDKRKRGK
jgi:hypothetical protein